MDGKLGCVRMLPWLLCAQSADSQDENVETRPCTTITRCKAIEKLQIPLTHSLIQRQVETSRDHGQRQRQLSVSQTMFCEYFARTCRISVFNLLHPQTLPRSFRKGHQIFFQLLRLWF